MAKRSKQAAIGDVPISELLARIAALEAKLARAPWWRYELMTDRQRIGWEIDEENPGVDHSDRMRLVRERYDKELAERTRIMLESLPPPSSYYDDNEAEAEAADILAKGRHVLARHPDYPFSRAVEY